MNESSKTHHGLSELHIDRARWNDGGLDGFAYRFVQGEKAARLAREHGACMVYDDAADEILCTYERRGDSVVSDA